MEMPISRAAAYMKRNRTTHSWAGDSNLMSRSCPNAHTLHDHMLQARASGGDTRYNRLSTNVVYRSPPSSSSSSPGRSTTSSEKSSRADKKSLERPSSSYSYDGGFFISANNASKDFFVIDPEWVSEDQTVKKLAPKVDGSSGGRSVGGSGSGGGTSTSTSTSTSSWRRSFMWNSYRRSKSAPPAKYRNPITWKE